MAYSGFGEYMRVKTRKLAIQHEQAVGSKQSNQIFAGLVFYFDGYLDHGELTLVELKQLVVSFGARVRDWAVSDVTHIIALQMTEKKKKDLKKPVVKPQWIFDSLKEERLLNWTKYRLFSIESPGQKRITDMFELSPSPKKRRLDSGVSSHSEETSPCKQSKASSEELIGEKKARISGYNRETRPNLDMNSSWARENTSVSADFVKKYFASSRLHHLSTWKNDLRDFVIEQMEALGKRQSTSVVPLKDPLRQRIILHVDMDCFFASIAMRDYPSLRDQPVVVAHAATASKASTSEIASCNYKARSFGIRNGMSVGRAMELCPHVVTAPYEFEQYDAASKELYKTLIQVADDIQAVSCDECFVDVSSTICEATREGATDTEQACLDLARDLREKIRAKIGCPASIGISSNILLARLATKKAKPDGIFFIDSENAKEYLSEVSVDDLPGIGYSTTSKLESLGISTCGQLRNLALPTLKAHFGDKTGKMLYEFARGVDSRPLENKERLSVGAEINWGVRFETNDQVLDFLRNLAMEVHERMIKYKLKGKCMTVKAKKRRSDQEPYKLLGCGDCDNISKSNQVALAYNDSDTIYRKALAMLKSMNLAPVDIRGLGIHMTKLVDSETRQGSNYGGIAKFFAPEARTRDTSPVDVVVDSAGEEEEENDDDVVVLDTRCSSPSRSKIPDMNSGNHGNKLRFSQIDQSVLEALPSSLYEEVMQNVAKTPDKQHQKPQQIPQRLTNKAPRETAKELTQGDLLPSSSQIDTATWNALPANVRKELQVTMKMEKNKAKNKKGNAVTANADARPKTRGTEHRVLVVESTFPEFEGSRDVQTAIDKFVVELRKPFADVGMFVEFLDRLVEESFVYDAERMLIESFDELERIAGVDGDWRRRLKDIVDYCQVLIETRFGAQSKTLNRLSRRFN